MFLIYNLKLHQRCRSRGHKQVIAYPGTLQFGKEMLKDPSSLNIKTLAGFPPGCYLQGPLELPPRKER